MAFNRTAVVIFVCIAAMAMSPSNALSIQEWGEYNSYNVKVYDDIEWFLPKQGGYREGKFNFPTLVEDETGVPITYIRVTNYASQGGTGHADIVFGGPGKSYVGLLFRSQLNAGINSRVEIYEKHA